MADDDKFDDKHRDDDDFEDARDDELEDADREEDFLDDDEDDDEYDDEYGDDEAFDDEDDEYDEDNEDDEDLEQEFADLQDELAAYDDDLPGIYDAVDELSLLKDVYYIWILWADMHIHIIDPYVAPAFPPKVIPPGTDNEGNPEHRYKIYDFGDHFSTSVGEELINGTRATGKYLNTIEEMVRLTTERAKAIQAEDGETGEGGEEPEIRLAFAGHEIGQRKAFKECIMSQENIVVTNFEPGEWGEQQLRNMEYLAERGFLPGV